MCECTVELLEKRVPTAVLYVEILGREEEEEEENKVLRNCFGMSTCYVLDNLIGRQ